MASLLFLMLEVSPSVRFMIQEGFSLCHRLKLAFYLSPAEMKMPHVV